MPFQSNPFFWCFYFMGLGGVVEALLDPASTGPQQRAIACAKAASAAFWGMFWWFFLWIVSSGKMFG